MGTCAKTLQSALGNAGKDDGVLKWWQRFDPSTYTFVREKILKVYNRIKKRNEGEVVRIR